MYQLRNASLTQIGTSENYQLNFEVQVELDEKVEFESEQPVDIIFAVNFEANQPNQWYPVSREVTKPPMESSLIVHIKKGDDVKSSTTFQYE